MKQQQRIFFRQIRTIMNLFTVTAQKMKFSINDFFSKCDQISSFLWVSSHLLKKSLMENFIFFTVSTMIELHIGELLPEENVSFENTPVC